VDVRALSELEMTGPDGATSHPIPTTPSTPAAPRQPPAKAPTSVYRPMLINQPGVVGLTFVRHGQQQKPTSPDLMPLEWVDPPLSDIGRRQAEVVGTALKSEQVDAVYCSHLSRAHETAKAIAAHHSLEPGVLPELREVESYRDLPDNTTLRDAIPEPVWRGIEERFARDCRWDLMPFSEGSAELRHRVTTVVEGLLAMHAGQHIVVVCHGGGINAYLAELLGIRADMFFLPAHASVTRVLVGEGRRVLHTLNELHFLSSVDPELVTY